MPDTPPLAHTWPVTTANNAHQEKSLLASTHCTPQPTTHLFVVGVVRCSGGHSGGETPGPIPNPEAKPSSADGTATARSWESRTPPELPTTPTTHHTPDPTTRGRGFFACPRRGTDSNSPGARAHSDLRVEWMSPASVPSVRTISLIHPDLRASQLEQRFVPTGTAEAACPQMPSSRSRRRPRPRRLVPGAAHRARPRRRDRERDLGDRGAGTWPSEVVLRRVNDAERRELPDHQQRAALRHRDRADGRTASASRRGSAAGAVSARTCRCSLVKGDPVIVWGRLTVREYEVDGVRRYSTEIRASSVGPGPGAQQGAGQPEPARRRAGRP